VKEGKSRHQAVFWGVIIGGVLITAAVISLYTPGLRLFDLREIVVSGNDHTSAAEIAEAARLQAGTSLLVISLRHVSRDVSSLPWVKSTRVKRVYPHRISICVEERAPVATISLPSGRVLTIGEGGVIVEAGEVREEGLPELVGPAVSGEEPGGYLLDPRVGDLIDALAFDAGLRGLAIRRIDVSDPTSIVLHTDGPRILLGGLSGVSARLKELAALCRTIEIGSYKSIDLRFKGEATLVRR